MNKTVDKCVIVASGSIDNLDLLKKTLLDSDLIICADGGLKYLDKISIDPDILLGDFDSANEELVKKYRSRNITILDYPTRKDATDSELAIDLAIEKNANEVILIGVTGSRFDHTLTNMHLLKKFNESGIKAKIINDKNEIYYVNKNITISGNIGEQISIIPISEELIGINTFGLEYPLCDESLIFQSSRGVSNVFSSTEVRIEIKEGEYFLIKSQD